MHLLVKRLPTAAGPDPAVLEIHSDLASAGSDEGCMGMAHCLYGILRHASDYPKRPVCSGLLELSRGKRMQPEESAILATMSSVGIKAEYICSLGQDAKQWYAKQLDSRYDSNGGKSESAVRSGRVCTSPARGVATDCVWHHSRGETGVPDGQHRPSVIPELFKRHGSWCDVPVNVADVGRKGESIRLPLGSTCPLQAVKC
jgi:hypothetical protein